MRPPISSLRPSLASTRATTTANPTALLRRRIATSLPTSASAPSSSSSSQAAAKANELGSKAQDSAKEAAKKAGEYWKNLNVEKRLEKLGPTIERLDSRLGGVVTRLSTYRQPLLDNLAVAREVLKQVYVKERLAPPRTTAEFQNAWETFYRYAKDLNWWKIYVIQQGGWKRLAVLGVELVGIWNLGEIVGKRKLVGYRIRE